MSGAIDLAHESDFSIGPLTIKPATRELVRAGDGRREVLEPRVMQVLVCLAEAGGGIVTREALTERCWEGRVVGEDAINRVISRLRRVPEGIGAGAFKIDTVTKVGYRLMPEGEVVMAAPPAGRAARQSRRSLLIGGGFAAAAAAIAGGGFLLRRPKAAAQVPPDVASMMTQAMLAFRQATPDGLTQSVGIARQVVALHPDYADGWGTLAFLYAHAAHYLAPAETQSFRERAVQAAKRALQLEPGNGYAQVGLADNHPRIGHWLEVENALATALDQHPEHPQLIWLRALVDASVGYYRRAAADWDRLAALEPPTPASMYPRIIACWAAGRMEDTDRLIAEGGGLYPRNFPVWFSRFYVLTFSGQPTKALAMAEDREGWPLGIPEDEIASVALVATALESRVPADIDRAAEHHIERAHRGAGFAENSMQFLSALGRVDDAFKVADAYFFGRGYAIPAQRFSRAQGTYTQPGDRLTAQLFLPSMAAVRADPRFARLTAELGLDAFWAKAGPPDFKAKA